MIHLAKIEKTGFISTQHTSFSYIVIDFFTTIHIIFHNLLFRLHTNIYKLIFIFLFYQISSWYVF